jgi:hypothetical protein
MSRTYDVGSEAALMQVAGGGCHAKVRLRSSLQAAAPSVVDVAGAEAVVEVGMLCSKSAFDLNTLRATFECRLLKPREPVSIEMAPYIIEKTSSMQYIQCLTARACMHWHSQCQQWHQSFTAAWSLQNCIKRRATLQYPEQGLVSYSTWLV